ncbi:MAG: DNA mismatch repair protein MutS [Nitrospinota bacterium]
MRSATPAMRQYLEFKERYPDAILFFQMGDFYEMFYEDARLASRLLQIALTSRQTDSGGPIPMCGVPLQAGDSYVAKLLEAGHKVAICEQVEDPRKAEGLVRREVVRVVTPGTATQPELLDSKAGHYLAALASEGERVGLAWADLSTGEFRATEFAGERAWALVADELARIEPKEALWPEGERLPAPVRRRLIELGAALGEGEAEAFPPAEAAAHLCAQFPGASGLAEELEKWPRAGVAAAAILLYLQTYQPGSLPHLQGVELYRSQDTMALDAATQRNLELVRAGPEGARRGSLLHLLDRTRTAMGARLLKRWVLNPLVRRAPIVRRHEAVGELLDKREPLSSLRESLERVHDLERILGRVGLLAAHARDLKGLESSLCALPEVERALEGLEAPLLRELREEWDSLEEMGALLAGALVEAPPQGLREGGILRDGYHPELDRLRRASRGGKRWLRDLEARERERTGIPSLRVGFNKVFGYYIELPRRFSERAPLDYVRRQTLANAERYVTEELKRLEEEVLTAEERARELEYELFCELRERVAKEAERVSRASRRVALLDVLASLAECAERHRYARPRVVEGDSIRIVEGRHPILDAREGAEAFVPNDLDMEGENRQILLVTGPNMAGKSTYLRQNALIVLMAQMGSFVPAREAEIGLVDRIFTRVGALDRLAEGQSTFMVEMMEAALILREATPRSLVVLDEVGRGTSTYDGVSIAWAVVEWLHDQPAHRAKTLFATHYHELAELARRLPRVQNLTVAVREWKDEVVFLRKVVPGSADRSYGIQVACLAGLPSPVVVRAREILAQMEERVPNPASRAAAGAPPRGEQLGLFIPPSSPLAEELRAIDPDSLSPREALGLLYRLKALADGEEP